METVHTLDRQMMSEITGLTEKEVEQYSFIHRRLSLNGEWRHNLWLLVKIKGVEDVKTFIHQQMEILKTAQVKGRYFKIQTINSRYIIEIR